MRLKILLPTQVLVDEAATKVIAEAHDGAFCVLPRHADFVAALAPGVLIFFGEAGEESFAALDEGILVKCADEVLVSTSNAVRGTDLHSLESLVEESFLALDEQERRARTALARLEAGTLRRFRELQEAVHG